MPDLSAARHTPLEAAVVSGYRALSHRLVIVVDNRQKAEERKQALLKISAAASREVRYVHIHPCHSFRVQVFRICFYPQRRHGGHSALFRYSFGQRNSNQLAFGSRLRSSNFVRAQHRAFFDRSMCYFSLALPLFLPPSPSLQICVNIGNPTRDKAGEK